MKAKITKAIPRDEEVIFPVGWLLEELEAATKEVKSWGPGMRRSNEFEGEICTSTRSR